MGKSTNTIGKKLSKTFSFLNPNKILFGELFVFKKENQKTPKDPVSGGSWGLTGKPSLDRISKGIVELEWQKDKLEKGVASFWKRKSFLITLIVTIIAVYIFGIIALVIVAVFIGVYFNALREIKRDLVKNEVAKKRNWLYDPSPDGAVGFSLAKNFPKIFKNGDKRYVDDQLWGSFKTNGVTRNFYSAIYCYTVVSHDSKGNRHERNYFSNFVALKLEKKLKSKFLLYPETMMSRIGQKFHNKEIDLESIRFNKVFAFDYEGKKADHAVNIVKALSPAVQVELVDLSKKGKDLNVYFSDDVIIFSFKGKLLKRMKTKLLGGLKLADEDLKIVDDYLQSVNHIAGGIVGKL